VDESALPRLEMLSRFIFQSNHFNLKGPKPGAFLPSANKTQISMMGIDDLSEDEIWPLGDIVGEGRGLPTIARADISAESINDCGLSILPDPQPHPRHVNVTGWPIPKEEKKSVALELCAKSILKKR
jgi:hypothetical protein